MRVNYGFFPVLYGFFVGIPVYFRMAGWRAGSTWHSGSPMVESLTIHKYLKRCGSQQLFGWQSAFMLELTDSRRRSKTLAFSGAKEYINGTDNRLPGG